MKRWLKTGLSLVTLRKSLGYTNVFQAIKFDFELIKSAKLSYQNGLVLSPHPDDDAFGMAGTIKKMTTAGAKITVAYFCDGAVGVPEGRAKTEELGFSSGRRDESLINLRKNETNQAKEILDISELVFFGYPDGKLASGTAVVQALTDLIKRIKPDIIFLPSFLDNHGDHRVTNEIFLNAARNILKSNFPVWAYEIWTPIFINRLIDISLYIKTKKEAILAHESQLKSRGYDKAILGLNQYRAEINNLSGFAEGFFAATLRIYRDLYRKS